MTRTGQAAFLAVTGTVAMVSVLLFLFPDASETEAPRSRANAQVIRPANTTKNAKSGAERKPQPDEELWQVIDLGEHRIGYARTKFGRVTNGAKVRIRATTETHLSVLRFGQRTRMSTTIRTLESADGDLLSFEVVSVNGKQKSRTTGRREREYMLLETDAPGGRTSRRYVEWRKGIKSPTYQDRMLRTFPMKAGEIRRFKTFDPQLGRAVEVRLVAENDRAVKLRNGRVKRLLRVRVTQSTSPTEIVYTYLDKKGRPVLSESDFAGQRMVQYTVPKAEALKAIQGSELDLGLQSVIRTAAVRHVEKRNKMVYRIHMERDDPARHVAANSRQKVTRIDKHTIDLTVTRLKLPTRVAYVRTDQKYLAASRILEANDSRVRQHAARAAGYQTDPVKIVPRMERYVRDRLKNKNFSTALGSAAEVARSLSGDCTEHAVLLAAMLRVRRIPSRIAIGLIYDQRMTGFVPHMWTEARLGKHWYPLDATRGEGAIGPAHIKLADASFADDSDDPITSFLPLMNVLGRWRIEVRQAGEVPGRKTQKIRVKRKRGLFPFRRR